METQGMISLILFIVFFLIGVWAGRLYSRAKDLDEVIVIKDGYKRNIYKIDRYYQDGRFVVCATDRREPGNQFYGVGGTEEEATKAFFRTLDQQHLPYEYHSPKI